MIAWRILFSIIVACFTLMPLSASTQTKIAVELDHRGADSIGAMLASHVREYIWRSASLRYDTTIKPRFIIYLVTIDRDEKYPGTATIYGYTITLKTIEGENSFLTSGVGSCGTLRLNLAAEMIIANINDILVQVMRKSK